MKATALPAILNSTCTRAARRAFSFVPIDAKTASSVEPILLPSTIAAANSQCKTPFRHSVKITAVAALDE